MDNAAMMTLAKKVADETIPEDSDAYDTREARMADWYVARDAALATLGAVSEAIECLELIAHGDGDAQVMARHTLVNLQGPDNAQ